MTKTETNTPEPPETLEITDATAAPPSTAVPVQAGELAAGEAPSRFTVLRIGQVMHLRFADGREDQDFTLSDEDAAQIVAYAEAKGTIPVDYDHAVFQLAQSTGQEEDAVIRGLGERAAAGFVTLAIEDDALVAHVDRWTARGQALLAAGEYRYHSPVIRRDAKGARISSLALTNRPAFDEMEALVAGSELTELFQALQPDPAEAQLRQAVAELLAASADATPAELTGMLLQHTTALQAERQAATERIDALSADLAAAASQLESLQAVADLTERQELIRQGLESGQLTEHLAQTWAAGAELDQLRGFLDAAPTIVPTTGATPKAPRRAAGPVFTPEQQRIARLCGQDPSRIFGGA